MLARKRWFFNFGGVYKERKSMTATRLILLSVGAVCFLSVSIYMVVFLHNHSLHGAYFPRNRLKGMQKVKAKSGPKIFTCPSRYQIRKYLFRNITSEKNSFLDVHRYVHIPPSCFTTAVGNHTIIILVKSAVDHVKSREIIRKTWAGHGQIQTYFVLGISDDVTQNMIEKEVSKYNDLVQVNFVDSYKNNTIKLMFSYDFIIKHCPEVTLVLFLDDDFLLETDKFKDYLNSLNNSNSSFIFEGFKIDAFAIRDKNSKWYVSMEEFPFLRWPSYLAGGSYVASLPTIKKFYEQFVNIRYFGIDDAWLGVVAKYADIPPKDNKKFHNSGFFYQQAFIKHCVQNTAVMEESWKDFEKHY